MHHPLSKDICRICGDPHNDENAETMFGKMPNVHQACYDGCRDLDPIYLAKSEKFIARLIAEIEAENAKSK